MYVHFNKSDQCAHLNMKIELEKLKLAGIASDIEIEIYKWFVSSLKIVGRNKY